MSRPRVLLNCASSLDGKIAAPDGSPLLLSDELDLRRVHSLRSSCEAVLIGIGTVMADNPSLRVDPNFSAGRDPMRVILDSKGRTPPTARVVDGSAPTLIFHGPGARPKYPNAQVKAVPLKDGELDLDAVLQRLGDLGVRRLLVEGGGTVLKSFVKAGLVDEWTLYQAPVLVGGEGPSMWPGRPTGQGRRLHVENVEPRGKGVLWTFRP